MHVLVVAAGLLAESQHDLTHPHGGSKPQGSEHHHHRAAKHKVSSHGGHALTELATKKSGQEVSYESPKGHHGQSEDSLKADIADSMEPCADWDCQSSATNYENILDFVNKSVQFRTNWVGPLLPPDYNAADTYVYPRLKGYEEGGTWDPNSNLADSMYDQAEQRLGHAPPAGYGELDNEMDVVSSEFLDKVTMHVTDTNSQVSDQNSHLQIETRLWKAKNEEMLENFTRTQRDIKDNYFDFLTALMMPAQDLSVDDSGTQYPTMPSFRDPPTMDGDDIFEETKEKVPDLIKAHQVAVDDVKNLMTEMLQQYVNNTAEANPGTSVQQEILDLNREAFGEESVLKEKQIDDDWELTQEQVEEMEQKEAQYLGGESQSGAAGTSPGQFRNIVRSYMTRIAELKGEINRRKNHAQRDSAGIARKGKLVLRKFEKRNQKLVKQLMKDFSIAPAWASEAEGNAQLVANDLALGARTADSLERSVNKMVGKSYSQLDGFVKAMKSKAEMNVGAATVGGENAMLKKFKDDLDYLQKDKGPIASLEDAMSQTSGFPADNKETLNKLRSAFLKKAKAVQKSAKMKLQTRLDAKEALFMDRMRGRIAEAVMGKKRLVEEFDRTEKLLQDKIEQIEATQSLIASDKEQNMRRMNDELKPHYEWLTTQQKLALEQREKNTILDGGARWEMEQLVTKAFADLEKYVVPSASGPDELAYPDFTKGDELDTQINDISDSFLHSLSDAVKTAGNEVKDGLDDLLANTDSMFAQHSSLNKQLNSQTQRLEKDIDLARDEAVPALKSAVDGNVQGIYNELVPFTSLASQLITQLQQHLQTSLSDIDMELAAKYSDRESLLDEEMDHDVDGVEEKEVEDKATMKLTQKKTNTEMRLVKTDAQDELNLNNMLATEEKNVVHKKESQLGLQEKDVEDMKSEYEDAVAYVLKLAEYAEERTGRMIKSEIKLPRRYEKDGKDHLKDVLAALRKHGEEGMDTIRALLDQLKDGTKTPKEIYETFKETLAKTKNELTAEELGQATKFSQLASVVDRISNTMSSGEKAALNGDADLSKKLTATAAQLQDGVDHQNTVLTHNVDKELSDLGTDAAKEAERAAKVAERSDGSTSRALDGTEHRVADGVEDVTSSADKVAAGASSLAAEGKAEADAAIHTLVNLDNDVEDEEAVQGSAKTNEAGAMTEEMTSEATVAMKLVDILASIKPALDEHSAKLDDVWKQKVAKWKEHDEDRFAPQLKELTALNDKTTNEVESMQRSLAPMESKYQAYGDLVATKKSKATRDYENFRKELADEHDAVSEEALAITGEAQSQVGFGTSTLKKIIQSLTGVTTDSEQILEESKEKAREYGNVEAKALDIKLPGEVAQLNKVVQDTDMLENDHYELSHWAHKFDARNNAWRSILENRLSAMGHDVSGLSAIISKDNSLAARQLRRSGTDMSDMAMKTMTEEERRIQDAVDKLAEKMDLEIAAINRNADMDQAARDKAIAAIRADAQKRMNGVYAGEAAIKAAQKQAEAEAQRFQRSVDGAVNSLHDKVGGMGGDKEVSVKTLDAVSGAATKVHRLSLSPAAVSSLVEDEGSARGDELDDSTKHLEALNDRLAEEDAALKVRLGELRKHLD